MIHKTHVIKLNPTEKQRLFFKKSCGVSRFSYNWALNKWIELYKIGEKTNSNLLIKDLTKIKREEYPWMLEVGKTCPQYAIHSVQDAFKRFFKKQNGYPNFKKKGVRDSFVAVENKENFKQKDKKIWIPRLGWVNCFENLRFIGKTNYVVIKRIADMWFAVINVETNDIHSCSENQATIGIDLGIKSMMVLSDGTVFENPKALFLNIKSLKRLQRKLSKKKAGSNNKIKQQIKIARKHYRVSCIRKSAIHKVTKYVVNNYGKIIIENLSTESMLKNKKLSRAIHDVAFGEIIKQLSYKAKWANKEIVKADRFFASTKICSNCGNRKESISLSQRMYNCDCCGLKINRDLNAAKNLANYGTTSELEGCKALGVGSSVLEITQSPTMNGEIINLNSNNF